MSDSQILSSFQPSEGDMLAPLPAQALLFDACQIGVTVRAVLFVEAALAVAASFGAADPMDWVARVSLLTAAGFPGVMVWLLVACSLKTWIGRLPDRLQELAGLILGAACGVYGCAMLNWAGAIDRPPWLAAALAGTALSGVLVAVLVLRARARGPAASAARLVHLQARIRPHFLFNTLNTAIALVRDDPGRAEAVLEDLSELFRHALAETGESVTLGEEVDLARRYLDIEQIRFGDRLRVQWDIDPAAQGARVPALCLQPLVENSVRHGVEPSPEGAQVKISTQRRGGTVVIKISNTVPAGQGRTGHGVAQANVRERLQLQYDLQAVFHAALHDGTYLVRIEVPA